MQLKNLTHDEVWDAVQQAKDDQLLAKYQKWKADEDIAEIAGLQAMTELLNEINDTAVEKAAENPTVTFWLDPRIVNSHRCMRELTLVLSQEFPSFIWETDRLDRYDVVIGTLKAPRLQYSVRHQLQEWIDDIRGRFSRSKG